MNLQVALRMRAQSVMSHATTLHQTLLRLKARGFHHPDGDTKPAVIQEIDQLLDDHTEREIASILNEKGLRTGTAQPFSRSIVFRLRKAYRLVDRFTRLRNAGMLTLEEMAQRLNLCSYSVKDWRDLGLLQGHRYNDRGECLYELPGPTLPKKGAWRIKKESCGRSILESSQSGAV